MAIGLYFAATVFGGIGCGVDVIVGALPSCRGQVTTGAQLWTSQSWDCVAQGLALSTDGCLYLACSTLLIRLQ